jgi:tyrosyl-tRNA synthetase
MSYRIASRGVRIRFVCQDCARKVNQEIFKQQRRWITQNHVRKIAQAEADWRKRAQDIEEGRKRSMLEVLEERGFVHQITSNRDELKKLMDYRRVGVYVGIDPTAASMHVGHMVPFMALSWMFAHGYPVYFVLGGSTARIGDPEGRLNPRNKVEKKDFTANMANMHMQLKRFGESMEKYAGRRGYQREWAWRRTLINNSAWHSKTSISDMLSKMALGIRLGPMLGRDSVKNRQEKGDGMSVAEFMYPLMQAWDWWHLLKNGVQIQIGGADQFGNILQGAEAVKYTASQDHDFKEQLEQEEKARAATRGAVVTDDPVGWTVPLLTTASGEKFGKSAGNAIWLDKEMTSPFELYQVCYL